MLYEVITLGTWMQDVFGFARSAELMRLAFESLEIKRRITSYNVCYTKLLRALGVPFG